MRRILYCNFLSVVLLVVSGLSYGQSTPAAHVILDTSEFIHDWQISKDFTVAVADAMPAESYSFKPNPAEMTFGEQMVHIAESNIYRFNQLSGVRSPVELKDPKDMPSDKASIISLLQKSFDYVIAVLPQITPEQLQKTIHTGWKGRPDPDGRAMMLNMFVHTAHHRAQCEVYLRLKGITPPTYTF